MFLTPLYILWQLVTIVLKNNKLVGNWVTFYIPASCKIFVYNTLHWAEYTKHENVWICSTNLFKYLFELLNKQFYTQIKSQTHCSYSQVKQKIKKNKKYH